MKKILPILVLLGACAPDITQDPAPPETIVVEFDPAAAVPVVPLPNDLALRTGVIVVPPSPTDSPAQKEFNEQYLGKLSGFPYESTASVTVSGDLAPESVNPKTVLAFDVTNPAAPTPIPIAPTFANKKITIPPPAGNWLRAHKYAIATIGGANGLKGAQGQPVIGSETWTLVSSRNTLVTCTDLKSPDCKPAVDVIPSHETDPEAKLKEQTASALQLEQLRLGYKPLLDALAIPRADVPIVWTFTIVDAGEMTFDPAKKVIPFPNDAVRTGPGGTIALPNPTTGMPLTAADCMTTDAGILIYCGLNTLDGFSTLVPPISENSDTAGALDQGLIDAASLTPMSVGLAKLKSDAPAAIQTTPKWTPCLNCQSSAKADGTPQTTPQQLQWKLDVPLDEKTTYFAYVTSAVKDAAGKPVIANPVFALVRSSAPLLADGKSTVSIISDDQAKQLEPLRAGFAAAFDGLAKAGIQRADIALAFPFTTVSITTVLDQLHGYPAKIPTLPDYPLSIADATAAFKALAGSIGITDLTSVAGIFAGAYLSPVAVTGPGGTLNVTAPVVQPVTFTVVVPTGTAPANGWPVVVYSHGFGNWRNDFIRFANEAAKKGLMMIAADALFHGDRATCTGSKAATKQATDDASCADPTTMKCDEGTPQGLCVLRAGARDACTIGAPGDIGCLTAGQGRCAADSLCQGAGARLLGNATTGAAPYGNTAISGWNFLSPTNFFSTRDNLRQQVIDLSALLRVLNGTDVAQSFALQLQGAPATGGSTVPVGSRPYDRTKIHFVGHSLGGIAGSLFASVSPSTHNVGLNVTGGAWTTLLFNSVTYASLRDTLLATLATQGLLPGTPAFDQFIGVVQWILDQADPANVAYRLTHPVDIGGGVLAPPQDRKAFISFIEGDQSVANLASFALVASANRSFSPMPPAFGCVPPLNCYELTQTGDSFDATSATLATRHRFFLEAPAGAAGAGLTTKAQTQMSTFLATGALP